MPRDAADNYIRKTAPHLTYVRDVPPDVRAVIGKTRWKISLKTAVRRDALKQARRLSDQHDAEIEAARAPKLAPVDTLSPEQRKTIEEAGGLSAYLDWLNARALKAGQINDRADTLRELVADQAGTPDRADDPHVDIDWARAKTSALDAERKAIEAHLAREAPIVSRVGVQPAQHPFLADAMRAGLTDPDTITLMGVFERWRAHKRPTAWEQYEYPVRLFEDLHGPLPLKQLTKAHVREFRDMVSKLPRGGAPEWKRLKLQDMLRRADERNLPRIGESTAAKYFRSLKTIFGFAVSDGYIVDNPADGIKFMTPRRKVADLRRGKRRSLTPDEIERMLSAAESEWADKPEEIWFVRLLVFSGARPEEIAQLAPRDIKTTRGIQYLTIHDEGENKLKSLSASRVIPVHPRLQELGFNEFVESRKAAPYLFGFKANEKGRRYAAFQRRLVNLMRGPAKIKDRRAVPYSLRHAFKDSMRLIQAPEEIVERIMGHSTPERSVARGYGSLDSMLQVLSPWMAKVSPLDSARAANQLLDDGPGDD